MTTEPPSAPLVLTEDEWKVLANICRDHLDSYKVTIAERALCERIIGAADG